MVEKQNTPCDFLIMQACRVYRNFMSLALWFKLLVQRLVFTSRAKDSEKNNMEHGYFQKNVKTTAV